MLKGNKVILRKKRWEDVTKDYRWNTSETLTRLDASEPIPLSFSEYATVYKDQLDNPDSKGQRFAIDTLEGKHIGNCAYYNLDWMRREAEIGIMLGESDQWDQGCGTEAVSILTDYLFSKIRLTRVYLHTLEWNSRAQRCFTKCGFMPQGLRRRRGYNFIHMDLDRVTWERLTSQDDQSKDEQELPSQV
ncbi:MAG: GNAT family N-acetyltransferase [Chloroflexota bacterium]|nr:GNAT family N-acetyltransferase [Chloroflexota bacterium]